MLDGTIFSCENSATKKPPLKTEEHSWQESLWSHTHIKKSKQDQTHKQKEGTHRRRKSKHTHTQTERANTHTNRKSKHTHRSSKRTLTHVQKEQDNSDKEVETISVQTNHESAHSSERKNSSRKFPKPSTFVADLKRPRKALRSARFAASQILFQNKFLMMLRPHSLDLESGWPDLFCGKNRPKCCPIHFLSTLKHNLNRENM
jgi:hypothetical protein